MLAGVLYAATLPPTAQESFTLQISIKVWSMSQNGSAVSSYIIPPAIGIPGGFWRVSIYDNYGLAGNYPVYTEKPPPLKYPGYSVIHVASTVNRTYYLGDLFNVWGSQLSPSSTLGLTAPPPVGQTQFWNDSYWEMCVGPNQNSLSPGLWGRQPLGPGMEIYLFYFNLDPVCP